MDFYISNNLTKSEFKARLHKKLDCGAWESMGDGYPATEFSFKKNRLSLLFFMSSDKEPTHISDLEFYFCRRQDSHTAVLESGARSEAYMIVFKCEECSLTFVNILTNSMKMRELSRHQSEQGSEPV